MPMVINQHRLAREFITKNPAIKSDIDSALEEISKDPFVDMKTKFYWLAPPIVFTLYRKNNLWILYNLNSAGTEIDVWNIGVTTDTVTFR
jgi:hypothetical protein